jgi:hypothetical protein
LQRVDILSGIGEYGLLLCGIDDGKDLSEPVDSINERTGETQGNPSYDLLYLKPFSRDVVSIKKKESDNRSPRYGKPLLYEIAFEDVRSGYTSTNRKTVHWTRVIHIADNRMDSDILGVPRLRAVYNRLLDVRKILSGSAEMFWKGGFPGYVFEVTPENVGADIDTDALKDELESWSQGLQRYLSLTGVTAKSLDPQIADPSNHVSTHLKCIAIAMDVPYRIFMGSEEAKLASGQDITAWNKRLARRQHDYVSPHIIEPFIDRMVKYGVLPEPKERIRIEWPDLNAPGEKERAEIAKSSTESLAKYVGGGVDTLIPPKEYLRKFLGMSEEEADAIEQAAVEHISEGEGEEPEGGEGDEE